MRVAWVVEDNEANFELVEFLLVEAGWHVVRARDSVEFGELMRQPPPDVLLLDVHLPDASGLELLARLRSTDGFGSIPVVALTAHAMRGDRERFLEAGCDAYISKPIETASFAAEIDAAVSKRAT